jgi:hypothetical protein
MPEVNGSDPQLSAELRRFVLTSVPSVPFLEALLLLRSDTQQSWDARRLARELYIREQMALELLESLHAANLAARDEQGWWRFAVQAESRPVVDELAAAYAADLIGITRLIHSQTERRAMRFADAFRWRKD